MLKRFANGAVLSGVFTLLASLQVVSDEAGEPDPAPLGNQMEAALESGGTIAVYGGRVTRLVPTAPDIAAMRILEQPGHGHASVNPDNTIALVLTRTEHVGALSFRYEVATPDGQTTQHEAMLEVIPSPQESGWGTGENFYMLPVDASDRVIVEHGDNHRKVYVSGGGLTAADIAARHQGVAEDDVTADWLQDHPQYGASEDMALHSALGIKLWESINGFPFNHSNWLLLERGHDYDYGWGGEDNLGSAFVRRLRGESPLHPVLIGAWGSGAPPKILGKPTLRNDVSSNVVVRDVELARGLGFLNRQYNFIFENVTFSSGSAIQGDNLAKPMSGITLRHVDLTEMYRADPGGNVTDDGKWAIFASRTTAFFLANVRGLLMEGVLLDQIGWAPDFKPDGDISGGQPPTMYSQGAYIQSSTRDVTFRQSIAMRGASFGVQFRGGAYVQDSLFMDSNIPFNVLGGDYEGDGPIGNYSLADGNVITVSARRGTYRTKIGAIDWGIRNDALLTGFVDNIVAHPSDPADPDDTATAQSALHHSKGEAGVYSDDTVIWGWEIGARDQGKTSANIEGLDPAVMDATTIQKYGEARNLPTATDIRFTGHTDQGVADFAQYARSLDNTEYAAATMDVLDFFRAGFGKDTTTRDTSTTLQFVGDLRGDGVRWDNRLNWNSGDLPGTVVGDSVDLGGNRVVFGGTVTLDDLTFGPDGGLLLTHGRLQVTGDLEGGGGATIEIDRAGQLWAERTTGRAPLTLSVKGGRFVNAGTFDSPVRLTSTGGQTILATGGAEFRVDAQSHVHIDGAASRIGFDGDTDETALIRFEPGAMLEFTATSDGMSTIGEFRSGAFGDAPAIGSGIDLGGASLTVNLTDPTALEALILVDVDEIIGRFEDVTVQGLGDRDAAVVINYKSDIVTLQLSSGTGQVSVSEIGTQDVIDRGNSEIRNRLEMAAE
jgi:hypothetical protein